MNEDRHLKVKMRKIVTAEILSIATFGNLDAISCDEFYSLACCDVYIDTEPELHPLVIFDGVDSFVYKWKDLDELFELVEIEEEL